MNELTSWQVRKLTSEVNRLTSCDGRASRQAGWFVGGFSAHSPGFGPERLPSHKPSAAYRPWTVARSFFCRGPRNDLRGVQIAVRRRDPAFRRARAALRRHNPRRVLPAGSVRRMMLVNISNERVHSERSIHAASESRGVKPGRAGIATGGSPSAQTIGTIHPVSALIRAPVGNVLYPHIPLFDDVRMTACPFCLKDGSKNLSRLKSQILRWPGRAIKTDAQRIEDGEIIAFLDSKPLVRGHTVLVPIGKKAKYHRNLWDYGPENAQILDEIIHAAQFVSNRMKRNLSPQPKKIYIASLCESMEHFHIHLIPRYGEWPLKPQEDAFWSYINQFYTNDDKSPRTEGFWYMAFHEQRKLHRPWEESPPSQGKEWFNKVALEINGPVKESPDRTR